MMDDTRERAIGRALDFSEKHPRHHTVLFTDESYGILYFIVKVDTAHSLIKSELMGYNMMFIAMDKRNNWWKTRTAPDIGHLIYEQLGYGY